MKHMRVTREMRGTRDMGDMNGMKLQVGHG